MIDGVDKHIKGLNEAVQKSNGPIGRQRELFALVGAVSVVILSSVAFTLGVTSRSVANSPWLILASFAGLAGCGVLAGEILLVGLAYEANLSGSVRHHANALAELWGSGSAKDPNNLRKIENALREYQDLPLVKEVLNAHPEILRSDEIYERPSSDY